VLKIILYDILPCWLFDWLSLHEVCFCFFVFVFGFFQFFPPVFVIALGKFQWGIFKQSLAVLGTFGLFMFNITMEIMGFGFTKFLCFSSYPNLFFIICFLCFPE